MSGVVRQPARKISNPPPSNRTSSSSNNSNQRRSGRATPSSESKLQPRSKSVVDLLPRPQCLSRHPRRRVLVSNL
ncbi:hypothetical protein DSO57_1022769 [Entomophthora muscae]|uniref:Uncharacterized protein n=1 Tax=Entomophthora muscae TaxID=34485 RepID=A0ACC2T364_9FUNG|nr:hypothetical protein DSO57_1022769 [Entomophthora muscae]